MADSPPRKERSSRTILRSRIEKQIRKQQEEQRQELLRRRAEIAKEGLRLYQAGRVIDGVRKYQHYILILEMWKKVGRDGLTIELFDKEKDLYEIVLLSGIYWDMAKLYDKARSVSQKEELVRVLQKYVIFAKGMPYQTLSGEALRRYLGSGKCRHRPEFKAAYQALSGDKCFVATSLLDVTDPMTIVRLRNFRDARLRRTRAGLAFIRAYYRWSPALVRAIEGAPDPARRRLGLLLDRAARFLSKD